LQVSIGTDLFIYNNARLRNVTGFNALAAASFVRIAVSAASRSKSCQSSCACYACLHRLRFLCSESRATVELCCARPFLVPRFVGSHLLQTHSSPSCVLLAAQKNSQMQTIVGLNALAAIPQSLFITVRSRFPIPDAVRKRISSTPIFLVLNGWPLQRVCSINPWLQFVKRADRLISCPRNVAANCAGQRQHACHRGFLVAHNGREKPGHSGSDLVVFWLCLGMTSFQTFGIIFLLRCMSLRTP
jgi:hypothetical protein